ncbi:MAG: hypothetical protein M3R12_07830 [Actinomycetota bacterium]|nr:hypothetical protein [Actinomycetota bacterium]
MQVRSLLTIVACAAVAYGPAAFAAAAPQLVGTVGPGFSIDLESAGASVRQLDPGTYEIVVRDLSDDHNFHLRGPGVDRFTQVEGTGTETWTVTLQNGRYTILCDPHPAQMQRELTVGTPPALPPPAKPPAATPKLLATVGPNNTIALRSTGGATLKRVKAGTYSIVVNDRSKAHNFHLVGLGVNRKSGLATIGAVTWKVKLSAGTLRFFSDRSPKTVKGSVVVF